jgi:hypothetical protein
VGEVYSSYLFSTSAPDGGEWLASPSGRALAPRKEPPVPIVQEAGWAPEPVWTQRLEETSFASAGDRTPIARLSSHVRIILKCILRNSSASVDWHNMPQDRMQ